MFRQQHSCANQMKQNNKGSHMAFATVFMGVLAVLFVVIAVKQGKQTAGFLALFLEKII